MKAELTPSLAAAVQTLEQQHPHRHQAGKLAPPTEAEMRAFLRELEQVPEVDFSRWNSELRPTQISLLLSALQLAAPGELQRAGKVLEFHWRRAYWNVIQRLVCEQPVNDALRLQLGQVLQPWLAANGQVPAIQFWRLLLEAPKSLPHLWETYCAFSERESRATLVAFLEAGEVPLESPLGLSLTKHLLLHGNSRQLLNEPIPRFQLLGQLDATEQLRGFVHYFRHVTPKKWPEEFLAEIADPRLRHNHRFLKQILEKLPGDRAQSLRERYNRLALCEAFAQDADNERFVFWSQFAGYMTDFPTRIILRSGQSSVAWHLKFQKFEVIEFSWIGAAYFYQPGWVSARRAIEQFPSDMDLKDRQLNFFPAYLGRTDNRLEHRRSWRETWGPDLWMLLRD